MGLTRLRCNQLADRQKGTGSSEGRAVHVPLLAFGLRLLAANRVIPVFSGSGGFYFLGLDVGTSGAVPSLSRWPAKPTTLVASGARFVAMNNHQVIRPLGHWATGPLGHWATGPLGRFAFLALTSPFLGCGPLESSPIRGAVAGIPSLPLEASPNPIELGRLKPGVVGRSQLILRNPSSEPISIVRVETSCPCLRAEPIPLPVAPGMEAMLRFVFDSTGEPEFRGELEVEVGGFGPSGRQVFQSHLRVSVADQPREDL